jgi:hypothetical protein
MDEKAKDDVYSESTRLYILEVALQEARKERMSSAIACHSGPQKSHMTMTAVDSSKSKPTRLH